MDGRVTDLVADGEDVADHAILLELVDGDVAGICLACSFQSASSVDMVSVTWAYKKVEGNACH